MTDERWMWIWCDASHRIHFTISTFHNNKLLSCSSVRPSFATRCQFSFMASILSAIGTSLDYYIHRPCEQSVDRITSASIRFACYCVVSEWKRKTWNRNLREKKTASKRKQTKWHIAKIVPDFVCKLFYGGGGVGGECVSLSKNVTLAWCTIRTCGWQRKKSG